MRRGPHRRTRMRQAVVAAAVLTGVVTLAVAAVVALAPPARAHAALRSSDPDDGALLASAPGAITLSFTEPPDPDLSEIRLLGSSGAELDTPAAVTRSGNVLRTALPDGLDDGVYTVSWRAVSEVDGHLTAGAFAFGVGVDPAITPLPETTQEVSTPPPSPATVGGRALLYAGIAILVGAAVVGRFAFGGVVPGRRPLLLGGSAALALGAALMVLAQAAAVDVGVLRLFGTTAGRPAALLVGIVILAVTAGVEAAHGSNRALTAAGVGAAAAALVRSLGGHAAAAPTPPLDVTLQWIHMLAVSVWIGGLVLLTLRARSRDERLAPDAHRFSNLAVVAAPLAVLTGVLRAGSELGGPAWLLRAFETSYGTTLAIKVAVVAVVLTLGGWNRFRGIARLANDSDSGAGDGPVSRFGHGSALRGVVAAEVTLAVVVFGLTGTFTGLVPRPQADATRPQVPSAVTARATDFAAKVEVRLRAEPGMPGPNRFTVRLLEPGTGETLEADAVSLRFEPLSGPEVPASELDLEPHSGAWHAEGSNLSLAGTWQVRATVVRGAEGLEVPLVLTTRAPPARVSTAALPGQPTLTTWSLPDGVSLQTYLDPEDPGISQAHITAFDPSGRELPLDTAMFVAFSPSGGVDALAPERFGEGHFVATVELVSGRWRFAITATTADGGVLQTSFSRMIGAT